MVIVAVITLIILMANNEPSGAAQFYQFILNLVPAIVSIVVSGQIVRYIFKWIQLRNDTKINQMIDSRVDPKLTALETKIDLLIKLNKDGK